MIRLSPAAASGAPDTTPVVPALKRARRQCAVTGRRHGVGDVALGGARGVGQRQRGRRGPADGGAAGRSRRRHHPVPGATACSVRRRPGPSRPGVPAPTAAGSRSDRRRLPVRRWRGCRRSRSSRRGSASACSSSAPTSSPGRPCRRAARAVPSQAQPHRHRLGRGPGVEDVDLGRRHPPPPGSGGSSSAARRSGRPSRVTARRRIPAERLHLGGDDATRPGGHDRADAGLVLHL